MGSERWGRGDIPTPERLTNYKFRFEGVEGGSETDSDSKTGRVVPVGTKTESQKEEYI